jgi:excinuclease ABC subunit C
LANLKEKVKILPTTPGIYLMKDQYDEIIYVGKAKNLKQRVRSYFQKNSQHSKKVLRMIFNIHDFDIIQVDTELDALLLECQLIQTYHPLYNQQMNHSLRYSYVTVSPKGIEINSMVSSNSLGPFRQYKKIPIVSQVLSEIYQMPWVNHITMHALIKQLPEMQKIPLNQRLNEITAFFQGTEQSYLPWMEQRISYLSEHFHFELAQALTEQLNILNYFFLQNKELVRFSQQKKLIFSLPLTETTNKYYQISFGQIIHTQILSLNEAFQPIESRVKPFSLTKTTIDPLLILMNYMKKTSKKG